MPIKEKLIGIILIIVGAFPLLLKIDIISTAFLKYAFLSYLIPGNIIYQIIIIILGALLIFRPMAKLETN